MKVAMTASAATVFVPEASKAEERQSWRELFWLPAAAIIGFLIPAVLVGRFDVSRSWFILGMAAATIPFTGAYVRWASIDVVTVIKWHWKWGVLGAVVTGAFLVFAVQNQDSTARPDGIGLAWDVLWQGVGYGFIDALLLSVLPVLITWRTFSAHGWTVGWTGKLGVGALALAASLFVTAAYHLGFPEYRGTELKDPLVGNGIMSVAYILTNNPIAAFGSHIAMHIAAVFNGAEGTTQLPPHY